MRDTTEEPASPVPPQGRLAHLCDGRARFNFSEQRGDPTFFDAIEQNLSRIAGVKEIIARPVTGSVIVTFEVPADAFLASVKETGVLDILPNEPAPLLSALIREQARNFEAQAKLATNGAVDLPALAFLFFATLGVVQLARGRLDVPAFTAFWYAIDSLLKPARKDAAPGEGP